MKTTATIQDNKIQVTFVDSKDFPGLPYLEVDVPEGWDDVKKIKGKVLEFGGRDFSYTGWNSDRNVAYFKPAYDVAKIK